MASSTDIPSLAIELGLSQDPPRAARAVGPPPPAPAASPTAAAAAAAAPIGFVATLPGAAAATMPPQYAMGGMPGQLLPPMPGGAFQPQLSLPFYMPQQFGRFPSLLAPAVLSPELSVNQFNVKIPKVPEGSMGINVRNVDTAQTRRRMVRVASYKPVQLSPGDPPGPGPLERTGFILPGDILIGVGGANGTFSLVGLELNAAMNVIKMQSTTEYNFRVLRPTPFIFLRGVVNFGVPGSPAQTDFLLGAAGGIPPQPSHCVAYFFHGPTGLHAVGPFTSQYLAAAWYDNALLSSSGTRAAAFSNFYRHLAPRVRAAEEVAKAAEARGDIAGARRALAQASYGNWTYAGTGSVVVEAGLSHVVRAEKPHEVSYRLYLDAQCSAPRTPEVVAAAAAAAGEPPPPGRGPLPLGVALSTVPALTAALWYSGDNAIVCDVAAKAGVPPPPRMLPDASGVFGDAGDDGGGGGAAAAVGSSVFSSSYRPIPWQCAYPTPAVLSPDAPIRVTESGTAEPAPGCAFPPPLSHPLYGCPHGKQSQQMVGDHPGLCGDGLLADTGGAIVPPLALGLATPKPERRPIKARARELKTTLRVVEAPSGGGGGSSAGVAAAAPSAWSAVMPAGAPHPALPPSVRFPDGPPTSLHSIFRGVRHSAFGSGAYCVFPDPRSKLNPAGELLPAAAWGAPTEGERTIGYYPSAPSAAVAYDRHARSLALAANQPTAGIATNFADPYPAAAGSSMPGVGPVPAVPLAPPVPVKPLASGSVVLAGTSASAIPSIPSLSSQYAITLAARNRAERRPELLGFQRWWLNGRAGANIVAASSIAASKAEQAAAAARTADEAVGRAGDAAGVLEAARSLTAAAAAAGATGGEGREMSSILNSCIEAGSSGAGGAGVPPMYVSALRDAVLAAQLQLPVGSDAVAIASLAESHLASTAQALGDTAASLRTTADAASAAARISAAYYGGVPDTSEEVFVRAAWTVPGVLNPAQRLAPGMTIASSLASFFQTPLAPPKAAAAATAAESDASPAPVPCTDAHPCTADLKLPLAWTVSDRIPVSFALVRTELRTRFIAQVVALAQLREGVPVDADVLSCALGNELINPHLKGLNGGYVRLPKTVNAQLVDWELRGIGSSSGGMQQQQQQQQVQGRAALVRGPYKKRDAADLAAQAAANVRSGKGTWGGARTKGQKGSGGGGGGRAGGKRSRRTSSSSKVWRGGDDDGDDEEEEELDEEEEEETDSGAEDSSVDASDAAAARRLAANELRRSVRPRTEKKTYTETLPGVDDVLFGLDDGAASGGHGPDDGDDDVGSEDWDQSTGGGDADAGADGDTVGGGWGGPRTAFKRSKLGRRKRGGGSAGGSKLAGAAGRRTELNEDGDEVLRDDGAEGVGEVVNAWKVDRILAVRFADLEEPPAEEAAAAAAAAAGADGAAAAHSPGKAGGAADSLDYLNDDEKAREHDRKQLALRLALPHSARRDWQTLEYLIRWRGMSYLHAEWVASSLLKEQGAWGKIKAQRFIASEAGNRQLEEEEARMAAGGDPLPTSAFIDDDLVEPERIIASRLSEAQPPAPVAPMYAFSSLHGSSHAPKSTEYLVKWKGLPYAECTWERAEDIKDDKKVAQFERFNTPPGPDALAELLDYGYRPHSRTYTPAKESPVFKGGRTVRDYQLEGLNWMVWNWYCKRNCILSDEMGLGKTVQTVSVLEHLRQHQRVRGPFLVLAPLSTLGHWKREFDEWTDMNVLYYHDPAGGAVARDLIREHEWMYPGEWGRRLAQKGVYKFNVVLTSYNVFLTDFDHFSGIKWRYVVVDEAHALKNRESQLQSHLQKLRYDALLLLTGTPLQNDVGELWSLLSLVHPEKFPSVEAFVREYGYLKTPDEISRLQGDLAPIMLRRRKEDVEKSIPPKEETIINVELTRLQKAYYRAIFERNRGFLSRGAAAAPVASLLNIEMELRKCCNHPFLLRGAEQREMAHLHSRSELVDAMVATSGKMVLLDKLLPKLQAEGHRVLIFSQFKGLLTFMEDLLSHRGYKYERIDGSIRGNDRQSAIDRFNKPGSDIFAFLLSTKAGGQGINLTAADTVIIYDSDWNPQNDVQAMARVHRIGQTKDVRIYRLVTAKTYEAEMFKRASRKLGLSHAVFESGGVSKNFSYGTALAKSGLDEDEISARGGGDGAAEASQIVLLDKDKAEALLRYGAYAIMDDEESNNAAKAFENSSIDQILQRSSVIRYDPRTGAAQDVDATGNPSSSSSSSTAAAAAASGLNFSKATFAASDGDATLDVADPSFWDKVLGPKPADGLLADLNESMLGDAMRCAQWTADLTALLDDVFEARCEGDTSDAAEACGSILIELTVMGRKYAHPLAPAGKNRFDAAVAAADKAAAAGAASSSSRSSSSGSGGGEPVYFPRPSPTVRSMLSASATTSAALRSDAGSGLTSFPEVDGECVQYGGTLADFAAYWIDRLEQGRRVRKRAVRTAFESLQSSSTADATGAAAAGMSVEDFVASGRGSGAAGAHGSSLSSSERRKPGRPRGSGVRRGGGSGGVGVGFAAAAVAAFRAQQSVGRGGGRGRGRGNGRGRGRGGRGRGRGGRGAAALEDGEEGDDVSDDGDWEGAGGGGGAVKRKRALEGEDEEDGGGVELEEADVADNGVPSISHIRIRLAGGASLTPSLLFPSEQPPPPRTRGGKGGANLSLSAALAATISVAAAPSSNTALLGESSAGAPASFAAASDAARDEAAAGSTTGAAHDASPSAAAAASDAATAEALSVAGSGQFAQLVLPLPPLPPLFADLPAYLFARTGPTRAEALAAADKGVSFERLRAGGEPDASLPTPAEGAADRADAVVSPSAATAAGAGAETAAAAASADTATAGAPDPGDLLMGAGDTLMGDASVGEAAAAAPGVSTSAEALPSPSPSAAAPLSLAAAVAAAAFPSAVVPATTSPTAPTSAAVHPSFIQLHDPRAVEAYGASLARRTAAWLMTGAASREAAALPALPPPQRVAASPSSSDSSSSSAAPLFASYMSGGGSGSTSGRRSGDGSAPLELNSTLLRVPVEPWRIVAVYNYVSARVLKAEASRGAKADVPQWVLSSGSVDPDEEAHRIRLRVTLLRKYADAAIRSANRRRQRREASSAAAAKSLRGGAAAAGRGSRGGGASGGGGGDTDDDDDGGDEFVDEQQRGRGVNGGSRAAPPSQHPLPPQQQRQQQLRLTTSETATGPSLGRSGDYIAAGRGGEEEEDADYAMDDDESAQHHPRAASSDGEQRGNSGGGGGAHAVNLDDVACCVCNCTDGFADDPIVLCEGPGCGVAAHAMCYGIAAVPEGSSPYFCQVCTRRRAEERARRSSSSSSALSPSSVTPAPNAIPCMLCHLTGGAYTVAAPPPAGIAPPRDRHGQPIRNSGWVHTICALWNPHMEFVDPVTLTPVRGWERMRTTPEWAARCVVCGRSDCGYCIPCSAPGCGAMLHPICGRRSGLRMEQTEGGVLRAFCEQHRGCVVEEAAEEEGAEDDGQQE